MKNHAIAILVFFLLGCSSEKPSGPDIIDSNAQDSRMTNKLVDSIITRRHLSITSFRSEDYDFQYLNEDEWGISFLLIRIALGNRILLIEQDSFTRLHKVFEYKLNTADGKAINSHIEPIIKGEINFPDSSRNLIDGGNISVLYRHRDTISVRYWQYNPRLPQNDLERIDQIVDSLRSYIERRKSRWQE